MPMELVVLLAGVAGAGAALAKSGSGGPCGFRSERCVNSTYLEQGLSAALLPALLLSPVTAVASFSPVASPPRQLEVPSQPARPPLCSLLVEATAVAAVVVEGQRRGAPKVSKKMGVNSKVEAARTRKSTADAERKERRARKGERGTGFSSAAATAPTLLPVDC